MAAESDNVCLEVPVGPPQHGGLDDDMPKRGGLPPVLARGRGTAAALCVMVNVLMFAFWQQFYSYFSGDPFGAYVQSNMHCEPPRPSLVGACPKGTFFQNTTSVSFFLNASNGSSAGVYGECTPYGRNNANWSTSMHCADQSIVLKKAATLNGENGQIACFFGLFAVFIAGQVIDTNGRKGVLMVWLSSNTVVKALLLLSCFLPHAGFLAIVFVQNVIEVAVSAGVEPALNAMIADLSKGNMKLRGDGFAALGVIMHAADVAAFFCGYPVLKRHLVNYAVFWGPLTLVSAVAYIVFACIPCTKLRETMVRADDAGKRKALSVRSCFRSLVSETVDGFKMVCRDLFLAQFLVLWALLMQALNGSWNLAQGVLISMGYEQANASMARPAWHLALVIGSFISPALIRKCGAFRTFSGSLAVMALGFGICGLGGIFIEYEERYFWGGTVALGGIGFGTLTPSFNAIISVRVGAHEQGKLFSFVIAINTICGVAFGQLWPRLLFDPKAKQGWRVGLPWLASAAAFCILLAWYGLMCDAPAAKEESSDDESEAEDGTSSSSESDSSESN